MFANQYYCLVASLREYTLDSDTKGFDAREIVGEILEGVNSGECRSRIWILGNFYAGSIEETFSDPDPVRRRLQENFSCVLLDKANQNVKPLTVWGKK